MPAPELPKFCAVCWCEHSPHCTKPPTVSFRATWKIVILLLQDYKSFTLPELVAESGLPEDIVHGVCIAAAMRGLTEHPEDGRIALNRMCYGPEKFNTFSKWAYSSLARIREEDSIFGT